MDSTERAGDELALLADTVADVLRDADRAEPLGAWAALERQGMTRVGLETGSLGYLAVVLTAVGRAAVSAPLAETHVAATLLEAAGLADPGGPLAVAIDPGCLGLPSRSRLPVRFAGATDALVAVDGRGRVSTWSWDAVDLQVHPDLAGEPSALVDLAALPSPGASANCPLDVARSAALVGLIGRAASIVGAGERALEQTMSYVAEREQFGRTLSKFQAVQQTVAVMASQVAAASVAVTAAVAALERGGELPARVAGLAAATQADRMAAFVARSAHQLHGAIGFTEEHSLRHATTRLTAWRSAAPATAELDVALGATAFAETSAWALLTDR